MIGSYYQSEVKVEVVIPTQTRYLSLVGSIVEEVAREIDPYSGDREILGYNLNLVLTEALANAIAHGSQHSREGDIKISIHVRDNELCIRVQDKGKGFDLKSIPQPDLDNPTGGGLGLFFIKTLMDTVQYHQAKSGNILEMRKQLR
ncbi:MAG: ATP-binding protein [Methylococcaceae bacterium]|nr:ATP-binding protein [Methylococcaceae bacterium]MCI0668327.1 ATP-binding protein [Methylococcaceae bacterium]MCI0733516.1 ATP-binding protein [Methylococcaceae bacterium]